MAQGSRICTLLGLLMLLHAGYSAHEFSTLHAQLTAAAASPAASSAFSPTTAGTSNTTSSSALPLDIRLETLISVFLVCVGLVTGTERLKPISWNVWAGQVEKESGGAANPYAGLEERVGFVDIRAKRKEFADWVRGNDT